MCHVFKQRFAGSFALSFRTTTRFSVIGALLGGVVAGCTGAGTGAGKLRAESLSDDPVVLGTTYVAVVYEQQPDTEASFFLSDVPVEDLLEGTVRQGQIMHVDLLWRPKAGSTPMDASATNAAVHHVIIADGEVGVYGGAGFAMPSGTPGNGRMHVSLRDATVRLLESTEGFNDPLSPAKITGDFTAEHDPALARKIHRAISQLVTNALGRSRLVQAEETSDR